MADLTAIEWCDATLNLWWGCTKVSDGCKFCYAEHLADHRYNKGNWGPKGTRVEVKSWRQTLNKISKRAKAENRRLRVFCQSMSDTFEGAETMGGIESENWKLVSRLQDELLSAILEHPELDFLLLTKRPENVLKVIHRHDDCDHWGYNWKWPTNLWIGTSIEDQKTADERIPHLLNIPAKVRFLSCEPLLGEVLIDNEYYCCKRCGNPYPDGVFPEDIVDYPQHEDWWNGCPKCECTYYAYESWLTDIHWVICGGESGPNARPMHPDWARSLRDQCVAADVPFLFKQVGEWDTYRMANPLWESEYSHHVIDHNGFPADLTERTESDPRWRWGFDGDLGKPIVQERVGKKRAGRLLDGREWNEFPEVPRGG